MYVMTRQRHAEGDEIYFWNASKGKRYNAKDIHCTLKEIYFIVDQHNIWGNVQSTKAIPNTRFDLDDGKVMPLTISAAHKASRVFKTAPGIQNSSRFSCAAGGSVLRFKDMIRAPVF